MGLDVRILALSMAALVAGACANPSAATPSPTPVTASGIHKIQHVVVIMQENRSFDQYFGTYPGADGLPTQNGQFTTCVPDPATGTCVKPYHDSSDLNNGGRDGLPRRARDPELLDVRAGLRAAGPDVRTECELVAAGAPVHGLGVVGEMQLSQRPDELRERAAEPRPRREREVRVDRPHLPDVQKQRHLQLLR